MEVSVDLSKLPENLRFIESAFLFAGDYQDISTAVFRKIPEKFLLKKIEKCGISGALCFAIFRNYPEASVSNFRQLTNSQLIFTVEQEGRFTEDVRNGTAGHTITEFLQKVNIKEMNFEDKELQFKEHFVEKPPKQQTDTGFKATSNRNEESALPKDKTGGYQRTSPILKRRVVSPPEPAEPKQNQNPTQLNTGFTSYTDASEMDFNVDSLTDFFIEEDAERLWKSKKYNEALPFLQRCLASSSKYDRNILQLKVALCMRETDRGGESTKLISQTLEDLRQNPPPPTRCQTVAEQMRKVGETYTEQSASSRALWIFKSASDIFKLGSDPDNAVVGIANCITNIRMLQDNKPSGFQLVQMIISTLLELLDMIKGFKHCSRTVYVDTMASSIRQVASAYSSDNDSEKAAKYNRWAVDFLYKEYGEDAARYFNYGVCSHNLAACMGDMGKHKEAQEMFKKALERQERATDWPDNESKEKSLRLTNRALHKRQSTVLHYQ